MLSIKFVPTIFLIYKGNVMITFNGFPDENTQTELFDTINLLKAIAHDENVIISLLKGADEWMVKSQYERAENMLNEAASHSKWKKQYGYVIKLGVAICAFNKQEYETADKLVKELKEFYAKEIDGDQIALKKCALLEIKLMFRRNPELVLSKSFFFNIRLIFIFLFFLFKRM
jgi:thioredoxin-like negative regulator of GroEL